MRDNLLIEFILETDDENDNRVDFIFDTSEREMDHNKELKIEITKLRSEIEFLKSMLIKLISKIKR